MPRYVYGRFGVGRGLVDFYMLCLLLVFVL